MTRSEERIIELIKGCTRDQINNNRGMSISTEFSASIPPTSVISEVINDSEAMMEKAGLHLKWRYYTCETCKQHDTDCPIHYETYNPEYENVFDDL